MPDLEIDLIPQEERVKRSQERIQKFVMVFSVVIFVLTTIASVALFLYVRSMDTKIGEAQRGIEDKKAKIAEKSAIEISARNLDAKYKVLSNILSSRTYYSILINELSLRTPKTVSLSTIDSSIPEQVNLSGVAIDYISLAKFLNSLSDPNISSGSALPKDKNLFKEVAINSVTLDPVNAQAKFNLNLTIDSSLLKKE